LIFIYFGFSFGDLIFSIVNDEWDTNLLYSFLIAFVNSFQLLLLFNYNKNHFGVFLILSSYLIGATIWLTLKNIGINHINYSIGLLLYTLILVGYYYPQLLYPHSQAYRL